jgi:uncharacterized membrane protein
MKIEKKLDIASWVFILVVLLFALYFNQILPDRIITHWDINGSPDGWGSKNFQVVFVPALMLGIYLLFKFLPKTDPRIKDYKEFSKIYSILQLSIISLFAFIFFVSGLANLGWPISIAKTVPFGVGILFVVIGNYIKDFKPNWFLGIRTPWTLSSDKVWQKTHQYGARMFSIGGVLVILIALLPSFIHIYLLGLFILLILSSIVYSYWLYRQEK